MLARILVWSVFGAIYGSGVGAYIGLTTSGDPGTATLIGLITGLIAGFVAGLNRLASYTKFFIWCIIGTICGTGIGIFIGIYTEQSGAKLLVPISIGLLIGLGVGMFAGRINAEEILAEVVVDGLIESLLGGCCHIFTLLFLCGVIFLFTTAIGHSLWLSVQVSAGVLGLLLLTGTLFVLRENRRLRNALAQTSSTRKFSSSLTFSPYEY